MATVTEARTFDHAGTQRKVRHPLALVRRYIRRYIFLEGAALTLLFASLVFWIGLGIDYGLYRFEIPLANIWGIDWLMELNDIDTTGGSSLGIRVILMAALVIGLLVLAFTKVVMRWFREFNDSAVALVLERRFPRELGDRLITAVELADPKLATKYGYSQAMVEKTILECVDRLKKVPVASVFNWRRLSGLWLLVALTTVGLWLVTMGAFVGASHLASEEPMTPVDFAYEFYDTGAIWTERNVLMQNTYWPRRAYLEIGRFQPSKADPNEMRIAKDDANRPELLVRAYEWVIADRDRMAAPHGWRALTWKDLDGRLFASPLAANVKIPAHFEHWQMDPEELEPNLAAALFDTATHERPSGEIRQRFAQPAIKKKIEDRQAEQEVEEWLDWRNWKIDKLTQQLDDAKVRAHLQAEHSEDYAVLMSVLERVRELAETRGMSRTLRRLGIPGEVAISFRGEQGTINDTQEIKAANKCVVSLKDLKDSTRFRFRVRGENYFTQPKTIALVAAPTPAKITIDKEEPAYIYHRLRGIDQMALRGQKHVTVDMALSTTGDSNTIEVPLGSNLVVHVVTDRKLREERAVFIKDNSSLPEGFDHYRGATPRINADRSGFSLEMTNLTRKHEFSVEYFDEDNIRGKRRFKVLAVIDAEPQMGNLHVFGVNLRKPKFKLPEKKDNDNTPPRDLSELTGALLITPDAVLPFECSVRDEYGLVRVGYAYRYRPVDFDLFSQASTARKGEPKAQPEPEPFTKRVGASVILGLPLLSWAAQRFEQDVLNQQKFSDGYASADGFETLLERMADRMIPEAAIKESLKLKRTATPWDFDFKNDRTSRNELGFDLQTHLKSLKTTNIDDLGQTHYLLKIAVEATDNNVETGAAYTIKEGNDTLQLRGNTKRNKNGYLNFLVISENQLLSQIALEEETIYEKLEATKDKLDNGLVTLSEQRAKIGDAGVDMDLVMARMNDIRTMLALTGTNLRDAHGAYYNIMQEMRINRVREDRKAKIQNNIFDPLTRIIEEIPIFPGSGSFPQAEDVFHEAFKLVERDVAEQQKPNVAQHRQNMDKAEQALSRLGKDINRLLDAMSEGIVEAKLIAILARIEQDQTNLSRKIEREKQEEILRALKALGIGEEKKETEPKKDDKKDEKKEEKKTTGLKLPSANTVAATIRTLPSQSAQGPVTGRWSAFLPGRGGLPRWIIGEENATLVHRYPL